MPPRYLIIDDDGNEVFSGSDYVDYLLEVQYKKDANPNLKNSPTDNKHSHWDNSPRPSLPGNFRIGKDAI